jgi:hypothetical protein
MCVLMCFFFFFLSSLSTIQSAFSFAEYTCLSGKFVFPLLSFILLSFPQSRTNCSLLACHRSPSPQRPQTLFFFVPFFYHRHSRSARTALTHILLFLDWWICQKKNVLCGVLSCCAGIWIGWISKSCENPKSKQSGMQVCGL